jgi:hypothetical protein
MNRFQRSSRILVSAGLSLLLLCLSLPAFAKTLGEDPELFRLFVQNRYDVVIRMGDECKNQTIGNAELRTVPEKGTPFQQMAAGNKRFADLLINLSHAVTAYPPEFFSRFQPALRFWLADQVFVDGRKAAGCFAYADGQYEIALSRLDSDEGSPHHEIWHAMEHRILAQEPDAFDRWNQLNPEGFAYTGDFSVMETDDSRLEPEDWFVDEYAKVDEEEDRAMIFRAMMTKDAAWWSTRPHLRKKAEFLKEKAEPVFGTIFAGE